MKNNIISQIINDLGKTKHYVEFKDNGKIYQLFGCDIERLNECINGLCCHGLIMVNDSLKRKEKMQVVKRIIDEVSRSKKDRLYIDSKGDLL